MRKCTCCMSMVSRYQKRISGPLLDRIDTRSDIDVPRVEYEELSDERLGEPSLAELTKFPSARGRKAVPIVT